MTDYSTDGLEAKRFLSHLWPAGVPDGHYLTLWTLPDRNCYPATSLDLDPAYIENITGGADSYYHLGLTTHAFRGNKSRPSIADVRLLSTLWLDLDAKNGTTIPDIISYLDSCFPAPSMTVYTGHGIHAYWLLRSPEDARNVAPVEEGFTRYHQQRAPFHIDSVYDVARVLRLPGTWNWKDKPPLQCRIGNLGAPVARYDLSEFPTVDPPAVTRPVLPVTIGESQGPYDGRDKTLFKLLCAMRRFNCPEEWLYTAAQAISAAHFSPPLTDGEVARKVRSALRYAPSQPQVADVQKWLEGK